MKLDKNPENKGKSREAALKALVRYEQDQAYINLALPPLVKNLSDADRDLTMKLAAGTISRLNTLDWALNNFLKKSLEELTPWIRNLLRISAFQLIYLDRVPAYAIVDEAVKLARRYGHRGVAGLVNAVLRRLARERKNLPWPDGQENPAAYLELYYSFPPWLVRRALNRFGREGAEQWCRANSRKAPLTFRPNSLRTDMRQLSNALREENISTEPSPLAPGMLRVLQSSGSPAGSECYKKGLYTIQGESSALVAPLLGLRPGDTVIDLCSAPGGKTTQIAELLNNSGLIYAIELHRGRLPLIEKASARLGIDCIKSICADGRDLGSLKLQAPAAVLVDAPCSGLGVIRRLPEIKWRRFPGDLLKMQKLQLELLFAAAAVLPVGGRLIYSVCTNEPEETDAVVEIFNREHKMLQQISLPPLVPAGLGQEQHDKNSVSLYPHIHSMDGFFIAGWARVKQGVSL